MVQLTNRQKQRIIEIFEKHSSDDLTVKDDIHKENFLDYFIIDKKDILKVKHGISKAVFFLSEFPDIVVKIPFTSCPPDEHWYPKDVSYINTMGERGIRTTYTCDFRSGRFESAWESIPCDLEDQLQDEWNYCEVESILYKEAVRSKVSNFFAKTECIGYVNDYPIYIQERGREYEGESEYSYQTFEEEDTTRLELKEIVKSYCEENHIHSFEKTIYYDLPTYWTIDFYLYYGVKELRNLLDFIRDFDISDLHDGNVGYINHIPVIIDYSSFHS